MSDAMCDRPRCMPCGAFAVLTAAPDTDSTYLRELASRPCANPVKSAMTRAVYAARYAADPEYRALMDGTTEEDRAAAEAIREDVRKAIREGTIRGFVDRLIANVKPLSERGFGV